MTSTARQSRPSDGFRILDGRGCLTTEVLCFSEQLTADQRAVVDRHARSCSVCAQQQTSLARASDRFRRLRPRLALPSELRALARQAALRTIITRRQRVSTTARLPIRGRSVERWYRSRVFWIALLAGMAAALLLMALAALIL